MFVYQRVFTSPNHDSREVIFLVVSLTGGCDSRPLVNPVSRMEQASGRANKVKDPKVNQGSNRSINEPRVAILD